MRAMKARAFGGYQDLLLVDVPRPAKVEGRLLLKIIAAGVTPLEHTILSGQYPKASAPLILGSEGSAIVEESDDAHFPVGTRVMFAGVYGVRESGAYAEYLYARPEDLRAIPDNVDSVAAAGLPVAYLTAQLALLHAGFKPGKTVLSPAIGGAVGNAVTQLARAQGAKHAISTTTSHAKALKAAELGFEEIIDLSEEGIAEGVKRITSGYGADVVIDAIGGQILAEAISALAMNGHVTTLGYSAGRKSTIDVTDLIWKRASMGTFALFAHPPEAWAAAWDVITPLLEAGKIVPIAAKQFPLEQAAEALRFLIEERPFGRVLLTT